MRFSNSKLEVLLTLLIVCLPNACGKKGDDSDNSENPPAAEEQVINQPAETDGADGTIDSGDDDSGDDDTGQPLEFYDPRYQGANCPQNLKFTHLFESLDDLTDAGPIGAITNVPNHYFPDIDVVFASDQNQASPLFAPINAKLIKLSGTKYVNSVGNWHDAYIEIRVCSGFVITFGHLGRLSEKLADHLTSMVDSDKANCEQGSPVTGLEIGQRCTWYASSEEETLSLAGGEGLGDVGGFTVTPAAGGAGVYPSNALGSAESSVWDPNAPTNSMIMRQVFKPGDFTCLFDYYEVATKTALYALFDDDSLYPVSERCGTTDLSGGLAAGAWYLDLAKLLDKQQQPANEEVLVLGRSTRKRDRQTIGTMNESLRQDNYAFYSPRIFAADSPSQLRRNRAFEEITTSGKFCYDDLETHPIMEEDPGLGYFLVQAISATELKIQRFYSGECPATDSGINSLSFGAVCASGTTTNCSLVFKRPAAGTQLP